MSKLSKSSIVRLQASLLLCLGVASVIAVVSLFVGHLAENESAEPIQQQKEQKHETIEDTSFDPFIDGDNIGGLVSVVAEGMVYPDVSDTGLNGSKRHDYCLIVGGTNPVPPLEVEIHESNTLRLPPYLCYQIVMQLYYLVEEGLVRPSEIAVQ